VQSSSNSVYLLEQLLQGRHISLPQLCLFIHEGCLSHRLTRHTDHGRQVYYIRSNITLIEFMEQSTSPDAKVVLEEELLDDKT